MIFVTFLSIFGNSLVISSIYHVKLGARTTFMKTKLSLAFSDLGFSFATMLDILYRLISYSTEHQPWLDYLWKLETGANVFFSSASLYNIVAIALFRFYAIKKPFGYMNLSEKRQFILIALTWLPGTFVIGMFLVYELVGFPRTFGIGSFCFYFLLPFSLIFISTIAMLAAFLWSNKKCDLSDIGVVCNRRDHKRVVKITIFMVLGYSITCCPYMIQMLHFLVKGGSMQNYEATASRVIGDNLFNLNCLVNILAYTVLDENFRHYVKIIFGKFF